MNVDECYEELGLAPDASDEQVKAAWRRLAARWHPDRNDSPQALARTQRINRALEEIRRARAEAADAAPAPPEPETVVEHEVGISLEEVVTGCVRELRGEVREDCAACEGSGLQSPPPACATCGGTGQVRQHLWFAWMPTQAECADCGGQGTTHAACACCEGSGQAPARKYRCRAEVPPGARSGDRFERLAQVQGPRHRQPVRLRLRVRVLPHDLFTAEADGTVRCELPVDGFAWTANRWIDVPTPHGLRQMRLQRGSLSYRIKGAGLPVTAGAPAGDCIVTVVPEFPDELDAKQEAAIDKLVAANTGKPGTAAGDRMAAWHRRVKAWAAKQD